MGRNGGSPGTKARLGAIPGERGRYRWRLRVYLGRNADGRTRHHNETFRGTEAEANRRLAILVGEHAQGRLGTPATVTTRTVAELLHEWLAHKTTGGERQRTLAPTTARDYKGIIDRHLVPAFGTVPVKKLDVENVERFLWSLPGETARKCHVIITASYKFAKRRGWVAYNQLSDVERPEVVKGEARVPTRDEVMRLLKVAEDRDPMMYVFIALAAATGCRTQELAALQVGDLGDGAIMVERAIDRATNQVGPTKTKNSTALIPVARRTLAMVDAFVEQRRMSGEHLSDTSWLFSPRFGKHYRCDTLAHRFEKIRDAAAVDCGLHGLRHFCATELRSRHDMVTISKRLRHTNLAQSAHYAAGYSDAEMAAAETMDDLLYG